MRISRRYSKLSLESFIVLELKDIYMLSLNIYILGFFFFFFFFLQMVLKLDQFPSALPNAVPPLLK